MQQANSRSNNANVPDPELYFDIDGYGIHSEIFKNEMSTLEKKYFDDLTHPCSIAKYLEFRNKILHLWVDNSNVQLTFHDIIRKFPEASNIYTRRFLKRIFDFLEINCFINFGVFTITKPKKIVAVKRTVCVIGAGISGIVAARQLKYFGFDVIVLEAGSRTGGRIYGTNISGNYCELGASFISKLYCNPVLTVMKQKRLIPLQLQNCRRLFVDGELVEKKKDKFIEQVFINILKFMFYLHNELGVTNIAASINDTFSLEQSFQLVKALLETSLSTIVLNNIRKAVLVKENVNLTVDLMKSHYANFLKLIDVYWPSNKQLPPDDYNADCDFEYFDQYEYNELEMEKCSWSEIYDSHNSFLKCMELEEKYYEVCKQFDDVFRDKIKDIQQFFSVEDLRILEWHIGVIEYLLGAPLCDISAEVFTKEDVLMLTASQIFTPSGYASIMTSLEQEKLNNGPLHIELNTTVKAIELLPDKVNIVAVTKDEQMKTYSVDIALCTLPLGVLKKAVNHSCPPDFPNKVTFIPPLSNKKVDAINRLGFGTINKVVMVFERIFWNNREHFIGNVPLTKQSRGEIILFFCTADKPILTAIICGKTAANIEHENVPDELIITRCTNVLREMFVKDNVPPPQHSAVSRWGRDPRFMGTHSYTSLRSSKDDYDTLAESVSHVDCRVPRLFFAGEHTSRNYSATVHGAFLSGMREASLIANHYL